MSQTIAPPRPRTSTRFLMTCAVLGVAGGLLSIGLNWASIGFAAAGVVFFGVTVGVWVLPSIVGLALLQKPGTGALIAVLAGLVNAPFTPFGVAQLPTVAMMAVLVELPFLVTLYRVWRPWLFYVCYGILLTAFATLWFVAVDAVMTAPAVLAGLYLATAVASLFFVWIALLLTARLRRAGVGRLVSTTPPTGAAISSEKSEAHR